MRRITFIKTNYETSDPSLMHFGVKGMKWGIRKKKPTTGFGNRRKRKGLTDKQKKALKIAGVAAGAAVGAYAGYKLGKRHKAIKANVAGWKRNRKLFEESLKKHSNLTRNARNWTDADSKLSDKYWREIKTFGKEADKYRNKIPNSYFKQQAFKKKVSSATKGAAKKGADSVKSVIGKAKSYTRGATKKPAGGTYLSNELRQLKPKNKLTSKQAKMIYGASTAGLGAGIALNVSQDKRLNADKRPNKKKKK